MKYREVDLLGFFDFPEDIGPIYGQCRFSSVTSAGSKLTCDILDITSQVKILSVNADQRVDIILNDVLEITLWDTDILEFRCFNGQFLRLKKITGALPSIELSTSTNDA